ncbi:MAG: response regulator [Actinobacteria bacterium]|nr:response regulator [Actinomycetota bacterium]
MPLRPVDTERSPRLVLRFAIYTGVALLLAAAGVMWFVRGQAMERAERAVEFHTRFVAETILRHELGRSDFEGPVSQARRAELDRLFREQVLVESTLMVTLWSADGTVTYSIDHSLIGRRPNGSNLDELAVARRGGSVRTVGRLHGGEGAGKDVKVVEAYVPVRVGRGLPAGVFQLHEDYAPVAADIRSSVTPVATVLVLALLALWASLFPILRRVTATLETRNRRLSAQTATLERTLIERSAAEEARQRSEEQLRQSQKMDAVGRLAGGIAHDFNNLLLAINGYSELALARLHGPAEDLREAIDEVRAAGERATALTRQLLTFSRKEVVQPTELELNTVVAELSKMLGRVVGEHLELKLELDPALDRVRADRGQLEQVLMNLAINARDAMPDGGVLRIATASVGGGEDRHVALTVADTGIGMDAETKKRIFEPFFTTKGPGKGTGLGLATVYGIVEQNGGSIGVESEPGHGTAFTIHLPVAAGVAPADEVAEDCAPGAGVVGTEHILLVEDDDAIRKLVARALTMHGYDVTSAEDPGEALELVERDERLDLLFTDILMPEMNGRELARRVAVRRPGVRVLYSSGYAGEGGEDDADDGYAFLQKPYALPALLAKVREVLDADDRAA